MQINVGTRQVWEREFIRCLDRGVYASHGCGNAQKEQAGKCPGITYIDVHLHACNRNLALYRHTCAATGRLVAKHSSDTSPAISHCWLSSHCQKLVYHHDYVASG